jgi:uracil-DNA glycosylase family 4
MNVERIKSAIEAVQCGHECLANVVGVYNSDKILFIGINPSTQGDLDMPFTGHDRETFEAVLKHLELSRATISVTNVVKCAVDRYYAKDHFADLVEKWRPVLKIEFDEIKPHFVVSFVRDPYGDSAIRTEVMGLKSCQLFHFKHPASLFYAPGTPAAKLSNYLRSFDYLKDDLKREGVINDDRERKRF